MRACVPRVRPQVGLVTTARSNGFRADFTAPSFLTAPHPGPSIGVVTKYQFLVGSIDACWQATDDESYVSKYEVALVSSDGSVGAFFPVPRGATSSLNLASYPNELPGATCYAVSGTTLQHNATYRVRVRATNAVGYNVTTDSSPVLVDTTAPVIGPLAVGPEDNPTPGFTTVNDALLVRWGLVDDAESPLAAVDLMLGSRPGLDDVLAAASIRNKRHGASEEMTGLNLNDGQVVYVTVQALNKAGLASARASNHIRVDSSPPEVVSAAHSPFVPAYSFPRAFNTQPSYPWHVTGSEVVVPLTAVRDVHSGIRNLSLALYATNNETEAWEQVGAAVSFNGFGNIPTSHRFTGLRLVNNTLLKVQVNATNGVGMSVSAWSLEAPVETETLTPGIVYDGWVRGEDMDAQVSGTAYTCNWNGFTDPKSEFIWYTVAVGTADDQADAVAWTDVGLDTEVTFANLGDLDVPAGTRLFCIVTARNDKGVQVNATSNGVVVGVAAPAITTLFVAAPGTTDAAQYVDTGLLDVQWDIEDLVVPLTSCELSMMHFHGTEAVKSVTLQGEDVELRRMEVDTGLPAGSRVVVALECTNSLDLVGHAVAEPVFVESSAPEPGQVVVGMPSDGHVGSVVVASADVASVHWFNWQDAESGIAGFSVCLLPAAAPTSSADANCVYGPVSVGKVGEHTTSGGALGLSSGAAYSWRVTAVNGAGMETSARSPAFTVDATAPSITKARAWPSLDVGEAEEVFNHRSFFHVTWEEFTDGGSDTAGLDHFLVSLLRNPDTPALVATVNVTAAGEVMSHTFNGLHDLLSDGDVVWAEVVAVDAVGNAALPVATSSVLVDASPPQPPMGVLDGTLVPASDGGADIEYLGSGVLSAAWEAATDDESGVAYYEVQVVDVTGDSAPVVVLDWSRAGTTAHVNISALPLEHGNTYVTRVRAVNNAGGTSTSAESNGVTLDLTEPERGEVMDGSVVAGGDQEWGTDVLDVQANWLGFLDAESSIDSYEWCVGTSPGTDNVLACHGVGEATDAAATPSDLNMANLAASIVPAGTDAAIVTSIADALAAGDSVASLLPAGSSVPTLFSTVTAVNALGLRTTAFSSGVKYDLYPPSQGVVTLLHPLTNAPVETWSPDSSRVVVEWGGFGDVGSGVAHYEIAVGTTAGDDDLVTQFEVPGGDAAATWKVTGADIASGTTVHVTVTAVDAAGWRTSAGASLRVDSTPPVMGAVVDAAPSGPTGASRPKPSLGAFYASWSATDADSDVVLFEWSLCPAVNGDVDGVDCAWSAVGTTTEVQVQGVDMVPGVMYVTHVRATNGAGLTAVATSSGFSIDDSAPTDGVVELVEGPFPAPNTDQGAAGTQLPAASYANAWDAFYVSWAAFEDAESGVAEYEACLGSSPLTGDLVACTSVGSDLQATLDASGVDVAAVFADAPREVYATVRATNGAGQASTVSSAALVVDTTPPLVATVFVGGTDADTGGSVAYVTPNGERLCADVQDVGDEESGIASARVALGTSAGATDVSDFTSVALLDGPNTITDRWFCVDGVDAAHGTEIHLTLELTNGAGLASLSQAELPVVIVRDTPAVSDVVETGVDVVPGTAAADEDVDVLPTAEVRIAWAVDTQGVPLLNSEVALCPATAGCDDISVQMGLQWSAVPAANRSVSLLVAHLTAGSTYHALVRATSVAGMVSPAVSSDGFVLVLMPPSIGVVTVLSVGAATKSLAGEAGFMFSDTPVDAALVPAIERTLDESSLALAHASSRPVHVVWTPFSDDLGVFEYQVCLTPSSVNLTALGDCVTVDGGSDRLYAVLTVANPEDAPASMVAVVEATNLAGHSSISGSSPIVLDSEPPSVGVVIAGTGEGATADLTSLTTVWTGFDDDASGVAMYWWSLRKTGVSGSAGEVHARAHAGLSNTITVSGLNLMHGVSYDVEVTAVDFAGQETTVARVTVADTTPPVDGWVHDAGDVNASSVDADWGNAYTPSLGVSWGGWIDPQSGPATKYEFAVMVVDPLQSSELNTTVPGSLLRATVAAFLEARPDITSPAAEHTRAYGGGHAFSLHEVAGGVMLSEFVEAAPNASWSEISGVRIVAGFTYVGLLRVTNPAGLSSVVPTDGIVFDHGTPCVRRPVPGLDATADGLFWNSNTSLSASWQALSDPLSAQAGSVARCDMPRVTVNETQVALERAAAIARNETGEAPAELHVSPLSHFTWTVEEVNDPNRNATERQSANTKVVLPVQSTGDPVASDWSACCSSFQEHNPPAFSADWSWRPAQRQQQFGRHVAVSKDGRRAVLAGANGAVVHYPRAPLGSSTHGTQVVPSFSDDILGAHATNTGAVIVSASAADVVLTTTTGEPAERVAALAPADFTVAGTFTCSGFTGAAIDVSSAGVTDSLILGVSGETAAGDAATVALLLDVNTATGVVELAALSAPVLGEAFTSMSAGDGFVVAGAPLRCPGLGGASLTRPMPACADLGARTEPSVVVLSTAVGAAGSITATADEPSFGVAVAASDKWVVVGEPLANNGGGAVHVFYLSSTTGVALTLASDAITTVTAPTTGELVAWLGFSLGAANSAHQAATSGTTIVAIGAPGSSDADAVVQLLRLDSTAAEASSPSDDGVVAPVGTMRGSEGGIGASVAVGGGLLLAGAPDAAAWPEAAISADGSAWMATLSDEASGVVHSTAYCWPGQVRMPATLGDSALPMVCAPCEGSATSAGGYDDMCVDCEGRTCVTAGGASFSAEAPELDLIQGGVYRVGVEAIAMNGRATKLLSDDFTVDVTPPKTGRVVDAFRGNNSACTFCGDEDIDVTPETDYVGFDLSGEWEDYESGIVDFQVAWGTAPLRTDIVDWLSVGPRTNYTVRNLNLASGTKYYACVVAKNGAGVYSRPVCSDGCIVRGARELLRVDLWRLT